MKNSDRRRKRQKEWKIDKPGESLRKMSYNHARNSKQNQTKVNEPYWKVILGLAPKNIVLIKKKLTFRDRTPPLKENGGEEKTTHVKRGFCQ